MLANALLSDGILDDNSIPIYLQSSDYKSLEKLNDMLNDYNHIKYTFLIDDWESTDEETIDNFAEFGHALGYY